MINEVDIHYLNTRPSTVRGGTTIYCMCKVLNYQYTHIQVSQDAPHPRPPPSLTGELVSYCHHLLLFSCRTSYPPRYPSQYKATPVNAYVVQVTAIQWLTPWYPMGKTATSSHLNIPGKLAWMLMELPAPLLMLYTMTSLRPSLPSTPTENVVLAGVYVRLTCPLTSLSHLTSPHTHRAYQTNPNR